MYSGEMKNMLAALSDAKDDAWDHHNPKVTLYFVVCLHEPQGI